MHRKPRDQTQTFLNTFQAARGHWHSVLTCCKRLSSTMFKQVSVKNRIARAAVWATQTTGYPTRPGPQTRATICYIRSLVSSLFALVKVGKLVWPALTALGSAPLERHRSAGTGSAGLRALA
jgi:hypothetical protein